MTKMAVYPGTFDPITNGHLDIIERSAPLFDKLIVAVAPNIQKGPLFTLEERVQMVNLAVKNLPGDIKVDVLEGLLIKYVEKKKAKVIVKGLRVISDFEYEFQMALINRKLNKDIETIFMMPSENYIYLSSRMIKEIATFSADLKDFIPPHVEKMLKEKFQNQANFPQEISY
ncbi:MAG: pantetheine-phosphate adenylyltransferase [bacterium]